LQAVIKPVNSIHNWKEKLFFGPNGGFINVKKRGGGVKGSVKFFIFKIIPPKMSLEQEISPED